MNMRRIRRVVQRCMYRTVMMNMLGISRAKHLQASAQRKGFLRRFLERELGLTTWDVHPPAMLPFDNKEPIKPIEAISRNPIVFVRPRFEDLEPGRYGIAMENWMVSLVPPEGAPGYIDIPPAETNRVPSRDEIMEMPYYLYPNKPPA